jgi:[ribosomal protein S18]-alanine N-acetyltransferase
MKEQMKDLLLRQNDEQDGILVSISIEDYLNKIISNATIASYTITGKIAGFMAYYNNDPIKKNAFLTMLLVDKVHQGKQIGNLLLDLSIQDLKKSGFHSYSLEVLKTNKKATQLYEKFGFEVKEVRNEIWLMSKTLR